MIEQLTVPRYWLIEQLTYRLTVQLGTWLADRMTDWATNWLTVQLGTWPTDRMTDWAIDGLCSWVPGWLTEWLIDQLTDWLTVQLGTRPAKRITDWATDWLTDCVTGYLTGWQNDWLSHWLNDWLTVSNWLTGTEWCLLSRGQFNKTLTSVIYKCIHCFRVWAKYGLYSIPMSFNFLFSCTEVYDNKN